MDAAAAHDIDGRLHKLADPAAQGDEFHQAEARILKVEEQIDVAGRAGLAPGDGSEQKQP